MADSQTTGVSDREASVFDWLTVSLGAVALDCALAEAENIAQDTAPIIRLLARTEPMTTDKHRALG